MTCEHHHEPLSRRQLFAWLGMCCAGVLSFGRQRAFADARQTIPAGKTGGWIDVHHHILPREYRSVVEALRGSRYAFLPEWDPQSTIEVMDKYGVAAGVASVQPSLGGPDANFDKKWARYCNEFSARLVADHRNRFGAFALLPLSHIEASLKEVEYALDTLKLDGVSLRPSVGERYLGDPLFNELMAELDRRSAVVFVHPSTPPGSNVVRLDLPADLVEFIFDTTRAVANLLFSGTFDRYKKIRFIFAHAGGAAPYLAGRWSLGELDRRPGLNRNIQDGVIPTLRRLYYETSLSAFPYALRGLQELADPTHLLFGSDYFIASEAILARTVAGLRSYNGFDKAALKRVGRDNALALFPRLAKK